jgi:branched-chain amino acid aminotransferase
VKDFLEVLAVGTAVGIISVSSITRRSTNEEFVYDDAGNAGKLCLKLLGDLQSVQLGIADDRFGWLEQVKAESLGVLA